MSKIATVGSGLAKSVSEFMVRRERSGSCTMLGQMARRALIMLRSLRNEEVPRPEEHGAGLLGAVFGTTNRIDGRVAASTIASASAASFFCV